MGPRAVRPDPRLSPRVQWHTEAPGPRAWCVCVPARDEADRLGVLLDALADQDVGTPVRVLIALNNTTDRSSAAIAAVERRHAGRLLVRVDDHHFPAALAHAGSARRRAMDLGRAWVASDPAAVLISTDADSRPPRDWVRRNLEAIDRGADLVGGRLVLDDTETSDAMRALRALWDDYWAIVREIEDEVDPSPADPAPRHGDHTGASLAITVRALDAAGGVPAVPSGEDRALVNAARAAGFGLVHPPTVWTRVSPRLDGRALGGMAGDMRRLQQLALTGAPPTAPHFRHWRQRAEWRRRLRERAGPAVLILTERSLPPMPHDMRLGPDMAAERAA